MPTRIVPNLCVQGAASALEFYRQAFGATEVMRLTEPGGQSGGQKIGHAEIEIDGARVYVADEFPEHGIVGPRTLGGSPVTLSLHVPDVDAFVARSVAAGAKLLRPVEDQFYGDRSGKVEDPFGHVWYVSTTIQEMSAEDMQRRYDALVAG